MKNEDLKKDNIVEQELNEEQLNQAAGGFKGPDKFEDDVIRMR